MFQTWVDRNLKAVACLSIFVLVVSPLLYVFSNSEWLYPEPMIYDSLLSNYFSYYYEDMKKFTWYKSARIPWNVFIFYLQKITGPYNLIPTISMLFTVVLGMTYFYFLKSFAGFRRAFLLLPWIVFFPLLISFQSGGGTYHNYASTFTFMLSLFFYNEALKKNNSSYSCLSGFLLCTTLMMSIIHLNLFLLYPCIHLFQSKKPGPKQIYSFIAGFIISIAFWGLINKLHGNQFFPHFEIFNILFRHLEDDPEFSGIHIFLKDLFFERQVFYLNYLWVGLSLCIIYVLKSRREKGPLSQTIFQYHGIFVGILWIFWNEIGQQALYPPDFSYPLHVPFFLAIALMQEDSKMTRSDVYSTLFVSLVLFTITLFSTNTAYKYLGPYFSTTFYLGLFVLTASFLIFTRLPLIHKSGYFMVLAFLFLELSLEPKAAAPGCTIRRSAHDATIDIVEAMKKWEPNPIHQFIYYFSDDQITLASPACGIEGVDLSLPGRNAAGILVSFVPSFGKIIYPESLTKENFAMVEQRDAIVGLYSNHPKINERFIRSAEALGFKLVKLDSVKIKYLQIPIPFNIYKVKSVN
jgi:hypothetical protein